MSDKSRIVACCSPNLNPCDFYVWGTLKDKVYVNKPHSLQELKENIHQEIFVIQRQQLCHVSRNIFSRCKAGIEAEGQHVKTLL
jgi:hypothetical protein